MTRAASAEDLARHGRRWLDEMLAHGVTTVEAKSGYGLDLATELRLIDVAWQLGREGPIDVVPTFLGAHAVPPEFRAHPDGTEAYVRSVIEEQIPGVAAHGRAASCDVFCERGVFSADQSRRILEAAAGFGMALRLHADELAPSGGAELAAELGALSADHLHTPSDEGVEALARGRRRRPPDGRDAAAGDDVVPHGRRGRRRRGGSSTRASRSRSAPTSTPGTSPTPNLPLVMTVALPGDEAQPRGGARGRDDQRRARGRGRRTRRGRSSPASRRTSSSGAPRASPSSRTGSARTSSTSS